MSPRQPRVLSLLAISLSLALAGCSLGGHHHGGGGGNGGGSGNLAPIWQISESDSGNFHQGQQGVYTITVTNVGNAPTNGPVQASATVPVGETILSANGSGWSFPGGNMATRSDSLAPGQSYPPIFVTVSIAANASSPQVFIVSISGGGAPVPANAQDSTNVLSTVSALFGKYAFLFSGFDANGAVSIAGSINVDANGNVTGEEDFKDPTSLATAQSVSGFCQNYPVPATGFCRLTVVINSTPTTYQYDFVLRSKKFVARFFDNTAADGQHTNGSGILITQDTPTQGDLTRANGFNGYFNFSLVGTDGAVPAGRIGVEGNIFTDSGANIAAGANGSQADINDNGTLIQPTPSTATNVTGKMTGPVDANGRVTAQITIGGSQTFNLAIYIVAPEDSPTNPNAGRAVAIDITPIPAPSTGQVLSGQFFWMGQSLQNPLPPPFSSSSISGANVFALWGVVPGVAPSSNTIVGILNATTNKLLFDINTAGTINLGGGVGAPAVGSVNTISIANNGRAVLNVTVNMKPFTYVLYLDFPNDGTILETAGDSTVSFGIFTGQAPTGNFDNAHITGNYVIGTFQPVIASAPNGADFVTLSPATGQSGGNFVAGSANGTYSFDPTTGRGTALASSGRVIGKSNVFYIIDPRFIILMGADPVPNDAIAFMQF